MTNRESSASEETFTRIENILCISREEVLKYVNSWGDDWDDIEDIELYSQVWDLVLLDDEELFGYEEED